MKSRFAVFAGEKYYPAGGYYDFKTATITLKEAEEFVKASGDNFDWYQIVDLEKHAIVYTLNLW